jgi:O-antigen/teichoic acid export membrane protein
VKHRVLGIWRSNFAHRVAAVASGTAAAQIIALAFAPFIARLYGPEAFGLLGIFMALVAVLAPIAALAYPIAIVLPKEDIDALALVRLAFLISAGTSAAALAVFGFAGNHVLSLLRADAIADLALLIPVVLLFSVWLEIAHYWLTRRNAFARIAKVAIVHSLVINIAKCGFGIFYPFAAVLVGLQTLGTAAHALMLSTIGPVAARRRSAAANVATPPDLRSIARNYSDFPIYRAPQNFINSASQNLPILMLASWFSPAVAGFYVLARTVLMAPSSMIAQSVGTVFYPLISKAIGDRERTYPLIVEATLGLAAIGILPLIVVFAFGPPLFALIFGADWLVAGEFARWLSLMLFFNFINRPCVAAIPALGLQRGLLTYELFSTGTKIIALYLGFMVFGSDQVAVALFSISGAIAYLCLMGWVFRASLRFDTGALRAREAG